MITELYIVEDSFKYQDYITKIEIVEKLKLLADDYDYIRKYDTEKVYYHKDIFNVIIYPGYTIERFLYDPTSKKDFSRNALEYLRNIIRKSKIKEITTNEVIEILFNEQSEETIHGLLALHKIKDFDNKYVIYSKNNWLNFHRYFLGIFPKNTDYYIEECKKYFPNLFFNQNIDLSNTFVKGNAKKVIHHLIQLDENYQKCIETVRTGNRIEILKCFNSKSKFEADASIEGNIKLKQVLTFIFKNKENNDKKIYCELHMKIVFNDFGKKEQNRIYFHEGIPDIENGKILIGHIGEHRK